MKIKRIIRLIFIVLILVGIFFGVKISIENMDPTKNREKILNTVFDNIQMQEVELLQLYTYGKAINLSGVINNITKDNFENIKLVIKDGKEFEKSYNLNYSINKKDNLLIFATDNNMNKGIVLDDLENGEYFFILRLKTNNSIDPKFYTLKPSVEIKDMDNIDYYTVTNKNQNKNVKLNFNKMNYKEKELSYLSMNVNDAALPEDVFDIVIDAGHGGKDVGESFNGVTEEKVVLEYAEKLKEKLEEKGYKIKLTRDRENSSSYTYTNMYDDDGRITIANESKAKLMISLHVNNNQNITLRGVEIYSPPKSNLDFAKDLAREIVVATGLEFSNNNSFKKEDGVYVRNFNANTIKSFENTANKNGYEPYNINTDTPYLYTIREVGGIATNAYVDGRNKEYSANKYYKSCQGIECYQIELGYIKNDLSIIQNDMDKIVNSITKVIEEKY